MSAEIRSVFIKKAVPFTFEIEGAAPRTVTIPRLPARHSWPWEELWSEFQSGSTARWTYEQSQEFVRRACKAGIPEPDPALACPESCSCRGNVGARELVDQLGREELDRLFAIVLEQNAPRATAAAAQREAILA